MVLYVKNAGTWHTGSPWFKRAGAWVVPTKVFRKVSGAWQEVWPLVPTSPQGVTINQVFRNDRIEADIHWEAPAGGAAVDHYVINISITNPAGTVMTSNDYTAASTARDITSTGPTAGAGYQSWVNYTMNVTSTAYSADGRPSDVGHAPSEPVLGMPAPPAQTGFSTTVESGALRHVWSSVSGNRVNDFYLTVTYGGTAYNYVIAKATSVSVKPSSHATAAVTASCEGGEAAPQRSRAQ